MKERLLVYICIHIHIYVYNSFTKNSLQKPFLIYVQAWKHVATKSRQIQIVIYFENCFSGGHARS